MALKKFGDAEAIRSFLAKKIGREVSIKSIYRWFFLSDKRRNKPLWAFTAICAELDLLKEMEQSVISYKFGKSYIYMENPKLPIPYSPYVYGILGHLLFDGGQKFSDGRFKGGFYTQKKDRETLERFTKLISVVFGSSRNEHNPHASEIRVSVPKIVFEVLKGMFSVSSFSYDGTFNENHLLKASKECKLTFLLSHLIDEGHVDLTVIEINSDNSFLIQLSRTIAIQLGYKVSKVYHARTEHRFRISSLSIGKLLKDTNQLERHYPELCLPRSIKQILQLIASRRRRNTRSRPIGQTRNQIVEMVAIKPMTVSELALTLMVNRNAIRRQIAILKRKGIIMPKKENGKIRWTTKPQENPLTTNINKI